MGTAPLVKLPKSKWHNYQINFYFDYSRWDFRLMYGNKMNILGKEKYMSSLIFTMTENIFVSWEFGINLSRNIWKVPQIRHKWVLMSYFKNIYMF